MIIAAPVTVFLPLVLLLLEMQHEKNSGLSRWLLPVGGLAIGALQIATYGRPLDIPDNLVDGTMMLAGSVAGLAAGLFCYSLIKKR